MKSVDTVLIEKDGKWYFQGVALKVGDRVNIDGVPWKVLWFGRSRNESQSPFLWIQNGRFGITVYFPSSEENRSAGLVRSEDKAVA